MIRAIESVHSRGILHVDVTRSNFCVGYGGNYDPLNSDIYVIDFGISRIYKDFSNDQLIPEGEVGHSRKEDLLRLGVVIVHFVS